MHMYTHVRIYLEYGRRRVERPEVLSLHRVVQAEARLAHVGRQDEVLLAQRREQPLRVRLPLPLQLPSVLMHVMVTVLLMPVVILVVLIVVVVVVGLAVPQPGRDEEELARRPRVVLGLA